MRQTHPCASTFKYCGSAELQPLPLQHRFDFGTVSRLDQDTSVALAAIREWRNSFIPINRFPPEVLSLIPILLPREADVIRASAVCRRWRRTFTQHAALWSKLTLTQERGDLFVKTWLDRAKSSALDITSFGFNDVSTLALLSSRTQQLRALSLVDTCWSDIERFAEAAAHPLPNLQSLTIHVTGFNPLDPETSSRPLCPLFESAVNLSNFALRAEGLAHLDHFVFPNLTTFELLTLPEGTFAEEPAFPTLQLLEFLESTPTLQTIHLAILVRTSLEAVPSGRIVVLPNVKQFRAAEQEPGHKIAAHISCPFAKHICLACEEESDDPRPQEAFAPSSAWCAVPLQFMAYRVDEVVLELEAFQDVSCSISFLSPGSSTFQMSYSINSVEKSSSPRPTLQREYAEVFTQASKFIQSHPLLTKIRRLRVGDRHVLLSPNQLKRVANDIERLFKSLGPLDELTLDVSDLRPYFAPFIDPPKSHRMRQSFTYPKIAHLTVGDRSRGFSGGASMVGIVEFAMSLHSLGVPLERVVLQARVPLVEVAERLRLWVGEVQCQ